ncbi:hypothetical protein NQZ68_020998 [Dissostichus eleginoides]|nr:hypothetical protein NQZ68_020998 [Dissostichus eleginoides]
MGAYAPSVLCFLMVPTPRCIGSSELGTSEDPLEAITSTMQRCFPVLLLLSPLLGSEGVTGAWNKDVKRSKVGSMGETMLNVKLRGRHSGPDEAAAQLCTQPAADC